MALHPDLSAWLPKPVVNHPSYVLYELEPDDILAFALAVRQQTTEECAKAVAGYYCEAGLGLEADDTLRALPDPPWATP